MTDKKDEALKLALEALGNSIELTPDVSLKVRCRDAITAIREALAEQPAQQQEPVAWLSTDSIGERYLCFTKPNDHDSVRPLVLGDTSPPASKPWVGLTDEEMDAALRKAGVVATYEALRCVGRVVEAKLREKNQ